MITKFIGSASEFLESNNIALVYSNTLLVESRISDYTPAYPFDEFYPIIKNSDGIFELQVYNNFKFNNVVIYNDNLVPIGFTDLTQEIDTSLYGIEVIQVKFDFTISSDDSYYIDINFISYAQHITRTPIVHKKLFSAPQRNIRTVSRLDLRRVPESDTIFTKSIYEMSKNSELIGRYSGNLSTDFKRITPKKWTIPTDEKSLLHDFIMYSGESYLVSILPDNINFRNHVGILTQIPANGIIEVSSNFILSSSGDIYSTEHSLSSGELIKIGEIGDNLYVKDDLTKMIHFYRVSTSGIVTHDKWLQDVMTNLNKSNLPYELKSVSEGTVVYENASKTYFCTVYGDNPAEVVGTFSFLKQLTNDLFIGKFNSIEDMGMFLIRLGVSYTYDSGTAHEYPSATQIYLGKDGKYRKLDLLSKNVFPGILETELSMLTHEGCCWCYEKKNSVEVYLRRL